MESWFQRAEWRATETLAVSCCSSHYLLIFRRDVLWFLPGLPDDGFSCNLAAHPFDRRILIGQLRGAVQRWGCLDSCRSGIVRMLLESVVVPGAHSVAAPIEVGATIKLRATVCLAHDLFGESFCFA